MIEKPLRIVLDTSVLVAGMLMPSSVPDRAISLACGSGEVLVSTALLAEIEDVFRRTKFNRYSDLSTLLEYLRAFAGVSKSIHVVDSIHECRDTKDNKILELALSGKADLIITGDADLLCLHPWRGISILSPAEYLERLG